MIDRRTPGRASRRPRMTDRPGGASMPAGWPVDRGELSAYLAAATAELAGLAHAGGFRTLGFLTDMARMEAERLAASFARSGEGSADQASETRPPGSR